MVQEISNIFNFINGDSATIHFIHEYGRATPNKLVREYTAMVGTGSKLKTRMAQNNEQCVKGLITSLLAKARTRLLAYLDNYTIESTNSNGDKESCIIAAMM